MIAQKRILLGVLLTIFAILLFLLSLNPFGGGNETNKDSLWEEREDDREIALSVRHINEEVKTAKTKVATLMHPSADKSLLEEKESSVKRSVEQKQSQETTQSIANDVVSNTAGSAGGAVGGAAAIQLRDINVKELHEELIAMGTPPCALEYYEADYQRKLKIKNKILEHHFGGGGGGKPLVIDGEQVGNDDPIFLAEPFLEKSRQKLLEKGGIEHVLMVHYTPLTERRKKMNEYLKVHDIPTEWVTGFDKQNITTEMKKCFVDNWDPKMFSHNKKKLKRDLSIKERSLTIPAQVSVVTKHHSALYAVVRGGYENSLILEDDALLRRNFLKKMKEVRTEIATAEEKEKEEGEKKKTTPVEVIMVGGCLNIHGWRKKFLGKGAKRLSKHVFEMQEARCAHAYFVTNHGAKKLLSGIPLTSAIDFQLNQVMVENNIRCTWVEPWLSIQGKLDDHCVTSQLGKNVKCAPVGDKDDWAKMERKSGNFDIAFAHETGNDQLWDNIPRLGSK